MPVYDCIFIFMTYINYDYVKNVQIDYFIAKY